MQCWTCLPLLAASLCALGLVRDCSAQAKGRYFPGRGFPRNGTAIEPRTGSNEPVRVESRAAPRPNEQEVAAEVDRFLREDLQAQGATPAGIAKDEDFLRRVTLDLAGTIPSAKEVTYFGLDPDPAKRSKVIDRLLASEDYAKTWGSYFREVVMSHATEARARAGQTSFENWLIDQFRKNRPWDEITTDLLTAVGDIAENGAANFLHAQTGQPQELAAEVSRIFLGIQMQCANCHDHPTDSWKREQFHQLAAYFPRVQVRQQLAERPPTFTVASADFLERMEEQQSRFSSEQQFRFMDRNRDGKLSRGEASQGRFGSQFDRLLQTVDRDKDGLLSLAEFQEIGRQGQERPGRGSAEYYMPDLNDPSSKGTRTAPAFFLDGSHLSYGTPDLDRRRSLARAITSHSNEWFSKAFVNRIWTEMLGEGFYTPVDDLGPERTPRNPVVIEALAKAFTGSGYDIQWLFRTIANTEAYQREIGQRQPGDPSTPAFVAAVATRLDSDQIYRSVQKALGIEGFGRGMSGFSRPGGTDGMRFLAGMDPGRTGFFTLFGNDPSTPQDEILGSVPQALFMMNSPILQGLISANGPTMLGRLLREYSRDDDALAELYLRVLSRNPSSTEVELCRDYLLIAPTRQQAYEDILWSLLNSSEFLTKR